MPLTTSSDQAESAARAAAADDAGTPIVVELLDDGAGETQTPPIDIAAMHGLLVKMLRGLVLRIDAKLKWEEHPNDEWFETTTSVTEILLDKYLGKMATSPEILLAFQITVVWMMPNVLASMAAAEARAAEARERKSAAAAAPAAAA